MPSSPEESFLQDFPSTGHHPLLHLYCFDMPLVTLTVDSCEIPFHAFSIHCLSSASDSLNLFPPVLVGIS
jgi:hypothetical protein